MKTKLMTAVAFAALVANGSAMADTVWDFTTPVGVFGQSWNWSGSDGTLLNIEAFGPNSPQLIVKQEGTDEAGMGLTNSPFGDNEITPGSYIQIAIGGVQSPTPGARVNFSFPISITGSSVQNTAQFGPEAYVIYGSNTFGTDAGLPGDAVPIFSCLSSITDCNTTQFFSASGFLFYDYTAALSGAFPTVLLANIDATVAVPFTPVPGPIVGTGLPGLLALLFGGWKWFRRKDA